MSAALRWTRADLVADHPYARPHEAAGYRLHGGFDADGTYISPRTLGRWPAVRAWGEALQARGWPLIDCSTDLLKTGAYPNVAQQKMLLAEGLGQTFWNALTVTGIIEARGQALVHLAAPDFQRIVNEDLTQTATGHLNAGLLWAHGVDEGGDPDQPQAGGAHDLMWFAARDLVFGKGAYPVPEAPASISRPDEGQLMPQIPAGHEQMLMLLMNVLMIEVRAEAFFAFCCQLLRDPAAFPTKRAEAEQAATMVERIRQDEAIHVGYLQAVVSEMRGFTFRTPDGGRVPGTEIIDPVWAKLTQWHGETERLLARARSRAEIERQVREKLGKRADKFLKAFDAA